MKTKFIVKAFCKFLIKNNAQEKFLLKLNKGRSYRLFYGYPVEEAEYISFFAKNKPYNLLTHAFHWSDNKEERDYWSNLSCKWEDYVYDVMGTIYSFKFI